MLVHCHAGISRSATVCIAYIMWLKHWTMECAYQFLKSKRSLIAPNLNFMRQLVEFENELEENCRGQMQQRLQSGSRATSQRSSTSTRSSDSSYASAVSCCDCEVLAAGERPCVSCASDLSGAMMTSSLRSASSRSLQQLQTPLSLYGTPLEESCHFFSSPYLPKPSPQPSLSSSFQDNNASTSFDAGYAARDQTKSPSALTTPQSASVVLLSELVASGCSAHAPSPAVRPSTAHPALCTLPPLATTCSQQVFSFETPSICSAALPATHSGSPTMCNSPLLSPS